MRWGLAVSTALEQSRNLALMYMHMLSNHWMYMRAMSCMHACDGAGEQQDAPTASAAASEASSAPDALEQTAETPAEGAFSSLLHRLPVYPQS